MVNINVKIFCKMVKVKYYPKENFNFNTHSFYAVTVPNGTVDFNQVCERACEDSSIEVSLMKAAVTEYMRAVQEYLRLGFRVQVGDQFITVYPSLSLSVKDSTDKDGNPVVATGEMLNASRGKSRLGATVATKYSQEFALNVSWQKIDEKTGVEIADSNAEEEEEDEGDGGPSVKPMG